MQTSPMNVGMADQEERRMAEWVGTGWAIEAIGGTAAIILAIAGLTGFYSAANMAAAAAIVLGSSLFLQGLTVAAEYKPLVARFESGPHAEFGSGLGVEAIAGVGAIVLGVVVLWSGGDTRVPLGICSLLLGGGLALSSGVAARLNVLKVEVTKGTLETRAQSRYAVMDASITQIVMGISSAVLGVLALTNISPGVLTLIAMMGIGASALYSGGAVAGRMWAYVKR